MQLMAKVSVLHNDDALKAVLGNLKFVQFMRINASELHETISYM
jgi:hypothetical protein